MRKKKFLYIQEKDEFFLIMDNDEESERYLKQKKKFLVFT